MRIGLKLCLAVSPLALVTFEEASAAGFALREQSASAQGNAYAGATAGAEDLSYMFFNPAALGRLDGNGALALGNAILPNSEVEAAAATTVVGAPIGGSDALTDIGQSAITPALYVMAQPHHAIRLGLGVNVPFGLATKYPDGWVGRYHGVESEVQSININPVIAVPLDVGVTFALGAQFQHIEAKLSNAVDLATITAGAVPADGFAEVTGDDWGVGFNIGMLYEHTPTSRIGIAYRSGFNHELQGEGEFDTPVPAAALGGLLADTDARADIELPGTLSAGFYTEVGYDVAVMGEVAWTNWSVFDELRVEFDNPAQPDSVTTEDWDDSFFFALGATYQPRDDVTLRVGVARDETPISTRFRTPRIPGNDRTWLSLGVGFEPFDNVGIDLAYTHIFIDGSRVRLRAADAENAARGNLDARYESDIDMLALSARISF